MAFSALSALTPTSSSAARKWLRQGVAFSGRRGPPQLILVGTKTYLN
jgi:hypothetical protein